MSDCERRLLSGNEAIALACREAGVRLGTGYPGTPSTEVLERFAELGGTAQWAPNEKVALEVGLGAAFAGARVIVTMKHVGLNVAADPLFTAAYTGTTGGLVILSADDPGMASSQNEQDNRNYAKAAGLPMIEPADAQEAHDFLLAALELSERWQTPVLFRVTTRCCHSKSLVTVSEAPAPALAPLEYARDIKSRVMIPAYARPAHRRLRQRLAQIAEWGERCPLNRIEEGVDAGANGSAKAPLGLIVSGVSYLHAREAAPEARILQLGLTYPLPLELIRQFAASVERCLVIEEGDPFLVEQIRAAGIVVEGKPEPFRFGELNVARVRRILAHDLTPEPAPPAGKPPQLCVSCPHRSVFTVLRELGCIVSGDIGCYTLGVLPPFEAIDACVCMGASIGVALGLRRVLPEAQARRVVSVIGDSTFMHSGLTGIAEMVYNPPATGHLVFILDNGTTAMTGLQEHPGTGRSLLHEPTGKVIIEDVVRAIGVKNVSVIDPGTHGKQFEQMVQDALAGNELTVIITRRPCLLAAGRIREYEKAAAALQAATATCAVAGESDEPAAANAERPACDCASKESNTHE